MALPPEIEKLVRKGTKPIEDLDLGLPGDVMVDPVSMDAAEEIPEPTFEFGNDLSRPEPRAQADRAIRSAALSGMQSDDEDTSMPTSEREALENAEERLARARKVRLATGIVGGLAGLAGGLGSLLAKGGTGATIGQGIGAAGVGLGTGAERGFGEVKEDHALALRRLSERRKELESGGRADRSIDLQERAIEGGELSRERRDLLDQSRLILDKERQGKNLEEQEIRMRAMARTEGRHDASSDVSRALQNQLNARRSLLGRPPIDDSILRTMSGDQIMGELDHLSRAESVGTISRGGRGSGGTGSGLGRMDKTESRAFRTGLRAASALDRQLGQIAELSDRIPPLDRAASVVGRETEDVARLRTLLSNAKIRMKELAKLGAISGSDMELLNEQLAEFNSPTEIFSGKTRFLALRRTLRDATRSEAEAAGIDPNEVEFLREEAQPLSVEDIREWRSSNPKKPNESDAAYKSRGLRALGVGE
jgi:hypothetical protein